MWIRTQNYDYVNSDNIYIMAIRKSANDYEIYADSADDKRARLGTYSDYESAQNVLDDFFDSLVRDDVAFSMPPKNTKGL